MPETGFLLTAKTFSFQSLFPILLLCYKELKYLFIAIVFHKETTPHLTVQTSLKYVIFRKFNLSKEANMLCFQTFKKLLKLLILFLKILHYKGYLGKI